MNDKTDKQNLPNSRAVMSRSINYEDGFGVRCGVEYDSHYRLGNDPARFVKINGIGASDGPLVVHMRDVAFLIQALGEAQELDERTHA